jgi:hypothetical protein
VCRGSSFLTEGGGGGGERVAESYDCEKAWPSINHSIFSAPTQPRRGIDVMYSKKSATYLTLFSEKGNVCIYMFYMNMFLLSDFFGRESMV